MDTIVLISTIHGLLVSNFHTQIKTIKICLLRNLCRYNISKGRLINILKWFPKCIPIRNIRMITEKLPRVHSMGLLCPLDRHYSQVIKTTQSYFIIIIINNFLWGLTRYEEELVLILLSIIWFFKNKLDCPSPKPIWGFIFLEYFTLSLLNYFRTIFLM